jgi:Beta/Gamma crystallin
MAHVILFEKANFHGAHKHVVDAEPNLNAPDDSFFNDKVRSLVVIEGSWAFCRDWKFAGQYADILGPGLYANVGTASIHPDDMSSLRPVEQEPTVVGDPLDNHVLLFQNSFFHGAHKHVFSAERNLNAPDDDSFNDAVSSVAVLNGNWAFYRHYDFGDRYPSALGPGGYPFVGFVQIQNDDMSSLQPVGDATVRNPLPIGQGVVLYMNEAFHGDHKHVVAWEANLNAPDDNSFNDNVSSIAVLDGEWTFFRDAYFQNQYLRPNQNSLVLSVGQYPSVEDVGIKNDDLSSLGPYASGVGRLATSGLSRGSSSVIRQ